MKQVESVRYGRLDAAVEGRIDELMGKMTLEEKIGQLVQVTPNLVPDIEDRIKAGGIGSIFTIDDLDKITKYQKLAVEETRLGIPLITGNDVIHGFRTIFPIPLAESCSWDLELIEQTARAAADESSATGTDWTFAPMVDIARDARWGRIAEGAGEDVYLGSEIGKARVRGFQSDGLASGRRVVACPKHYVAYGAAEAGREYNTVDISERTLRDVYLPPFKAAFDEGAGTAMSAFNDLNGVPTSGNVFTLREILREEWGWLGMVVSDFESIMEMIAHGYAEDLKDASRLGIIAGVDMDMQALGYSRHLAALISEGKVPESIVDESVRRVLRLKIELGLFEKPYADPKLVDEIVLSEEYRELALKAAQGSMVLLKNEGGILPLSPSGKRVALIGPLADSKKDMLGTWSFFGKAENADTVVDGFGTYLDGVISVPGCGVKDGDAADIEAAVEIARSADVVVLVVGESEDMSGEAHSRTRLGLPGRQQELVDAVVAVGKPVALVLMCGRPMVASAFVDKVDALLVAWHGGIRAGQAVADVVFGAASPSGKLTASWPRSEGQIPVYYNQKNTGRPIDGPPTMQFEEPFRSTFIDSPNAPLFPFGYGLTYTTFEYSDISMETPSLGMDGTLRVSATVKNTGERDGVEIVQLYVRDLVGSVTRPVRELKGFQRIEIKAGESKMVRFEVPVSELGFHGLDMKYIVEAGAFKVWVGPNAVDGLEGSFRVE